MSLISNHLDSLKWQQNRQVALKHMHQQIYGNISKLIPHEKPRWHMYEPTLIINALFGVQIQACSVLKNKALKVLHAFVHLLLGI